VNRRNLLTGSAGVAVVAMTGGAVWTGTQARTPAQRAARAAPPAPSVITVAVRAGELAEQEVLDGVVELARSVAVPGPAAVRGTARLVVTRAPVRVDDRVRDGDVVAEVSGRPVIVMTGAFPAYRELRRGLDGPDVRQLQRALRTRASGRFDGATEAALSTLYRRHGYRPVRSEGRAVLPLGEVAFVPALPARVTATALEVGADARGALVTLGAGPAQVVADVGPQARQMIEAGGREIRFGDGPLRDVRARFVKFREGPAAEGGQPVVAAVFAADRPVGEVGAGQQVLLTGRRSEPGALIVPATALWTAADGRVTVSVLRDAEPRPVPVRVVLTVAGESVVTGDLTAGDEVVVGDR
jgi:hypothetical protein